MDKHTAKQILTRMETCIGLLSEVVQIAHANANEEESRVVRRGVGHVLSEIQDRLTDPMYREFRELLPQGVDYTPLDGPTLTEIATLLGKTASAE